MPTVLSSRPGAVRLLEDAAVQAAIPPIVGLKAPDKLQFGSERALINSVGIQEAANFQFMQTLGSDVFVYVFGDRIGQVQIGGLAFAADCNPSSRATEHGAAKVRRWFNQRKLSSRVEPVNILFGNATEPLSGFVTGWSAKIADVPSNLISWTISMALIPERVNTSGG